MKKVFSRGLNIHGQCGLGHKIYHSSEKFTEIPMKLPIIKIKSNIGHTVALDEDKKTIYFWGFNWDLRSFFRIGMIYNYAPNFIKIFKV